MINYQSNTYFYFVLIALACFFFLKNKFSKTQAIFILNLIFHSLLFYFDKKRFIYFQGIILLNFMVVYYFQNNEKNIFYQNKNFIQLVTALNLIYFILVKYTYTNILTKMGLVSFVGYSFLILRLTSILIDTQRKVIKGPIIFLDYYNYLTFFPAYLSGPVNRFNQFVTDIRSSEINTPKKQFDYTFRIIWGAFKKIVIADNLFQFSINSINTNDLSHVSLFKILISTYVYCGMIYFDFSGYSDMAIGISGLFGINIPENFSRPLLSKNIQEFWNRWHISLMHWMRDYVYYPIQMYFLKDLKMNILAASVLGYLITFLITGLWHGSQIQYFYYGLYHGIAFSLFLFWKKFIQSALSQPQKDFYNNSKIISYTAIFITFHYYIISLLLYSGKYEYFIRP